METKEYSENKGITVLWTPSKCKHAGVCVKTLPRVYHPKDKPWITPMEASAEELKSQIEKCPTGALGYRMNE
ncbi:putative Fe-S cluster protein YjdI [Elizabethkingia sp. YR214]|uniref:(4Fe-4S)-binding protein n=1 Tax=Elizabethkingia sp. YR214 TaxID=2135667 RepID=UPI000D300A59|nr:(4Fe-4S)-binding protein [Elizabethkingia sp. YR214]PUB34363.1 putative Fe-S cluster protein YjdI [Elizabethkingia sp. YR214]